jgi:predicted nucleic acid-binding protein
MALVVADTSPLRFLVEIGCEHVLPQLFQRVWIPGAVAGELRHARTPELVRCWSERLPSWVEVREISTPGFDPDSAEMDRGEWEAIELARQIHAHLLLIDDRAGVQAARAQGFTVTGTLGVLVEAAAARLIEIEEALEKLGQTKFRRTPDLFAQTVKLARARREQRSHE